MAVIKITRSRSFLLEYFEAISDCEADFQFLRSDQLIISWFRYPRASATENGPTIAGMLTPGILPCRKPSARRLTCSTVSLTLALRLGSRAFKLRRRKARAALIFWSLSIAPR